MGNGKLESILEGFAAAVLPIRESLERISVEFLRQRTAREEKLEKDRILAGMLQRAEAAIYGRDLSGNKIPLNEKASDQIKAEASACREEKRPMFYEHPSGTLIPLNAAGVHALARQKLLKDFKDRKILKATTPKAESCPHSVASESGEEWPCMDCSRSPLLWNHDPEKVLSDAELEEIFEHPPGVIVTTCEATTKEGRERIGGIYRDALAELRRLRKDGQQAEKQHAAGIRDKRNLGEWIPEKKRAGLHYLREAIAEHAPDAQQVAKLIATAALIDSTVGLFVRDYDRDHDSEGVPQCLVTLQFQMPAFDRKS